MTDGRLAELVAQLEPLASGRKQIDASREIIDFVRFLDELLQAHLEGDIQWNGVLAAVEASQYGDETRGTVVLPEDATPQQVRQLATQCDRVETAEQATLLAVEEQSRKAFATGEKILDGLHGDSKRLRNEAISKCLAIALPIVEEVARKLGERKGDRKEISRWLRQAVRELETALGEYRGPAQQLMFLAGLRRPRRRLSEDIHEIALNHEDELRSRTAKFVGSLFGVSGRTAYDARKKASENPRDAAE